MNECNQNVTCACDVTRAPGFFYPRLLSSPSYSSPAPNHPAIHPHTHIKRVAAFVQGEMSLSSAKQRLLACASLPLFVHHDATDAYFGRFLRRNYHYVEVVPLHRKLLDQQRRQQQQHEWARSDIGGGGGGGDDDNGGENNGNTSFTAAASSTSQPPPTMTLSAAEASKKLCEDVDKVVEWANKNEGNAAKGIGAHARRFATSLLGPRMVQQYLLSVLTEVSRLQQQHPSRYPWGTVAGQPNMKKITKQSLAKLVEKASGHASKGGAVEALQAMWGGERCPRERCPRCCQAPVPIFGERDRGNGGGGGKEFMEIGGSAFSSTQQPAATVRPPPPPAPPPIPEVTQSGKSSSSSSSSSGDWWARSKGKKWSPTNRTAVQRQAKASGWVVAG